MNFGEFYVTTCSLFPNAHADSPIGQYVQAKRNELSSAITDGGEILISGSITNGSINVTCIGASPPTLDIEQRRGEHTEFVAHSPEVRIPHVVTPRVNTAEMRR